MTATYFLSDLATNNTLNMLAAQVEGLKDVEFTLGNFSYRNSIVQENIFRHMEETNFTGITVLLLAT